MVWQEVTYLISFKKSPLSAKYWRWILRHYIISYSKGSHLWIFETVRFKLSIVFYWDPIQNTSDLPKCQLPFLPCTYKLHYTCNMFGLWHSCSLLWDLLRTGKPGPFLFVLHCLVEDLIGPRNWIWRFSVCIVLRIVSFSFFNSLILISFLPFWFYSCMISTNKKVIWIEYDREEYL